MHDKLYQILQGILILNDIVFCYRGADSVLDIVIRLQAGCSRIFGLTLALGRRFISSPNSPHQLWDPLSFIFSGCWGLFPQGGSVQGVKLSNLNLLLRLRMNRAVPPFPPMPSWPGQGLYPFLYFMLVVHGDAVGGSTALKVGRTRVRFPMGSLGFFIDLILLAAPEPSGPLSLLRK
jgi:hypothetical protein